MALLLDTLQKPEADNGVKSPSLLEWRHHPDKKFDHVVLGRGHPGGVWQSIDGDLLTVSAGAWMELPAMSMSDWSESGATGAEAELTGRASVASVSHYYQDYVKKMGLEQNFRSYSMVTEVRQLRCNEMREEEDAIVPDVNHVNTSQDSADSEIQQEEVFSFENDDDDLSSACSSLTRRRSLSSNSFESQSFFGPSPGQAPTSHQEYDTIDQERGYSFTRQDSTLSNVDNWDPIINPSLFGDQSYLGRSLSQEVPVSPESLRSVEGMEDYCNSLKCSLVRRCCPEADTLFEVRGWTQEPGQSEPTQFRYMTKNVVLATGMADIPNRLNVPGEDRPFVLHKLSQLNHLVKSGGLSPESDPVLIVGAGLSAADAVIAAQSHNISLLHVFRKHPRDPSIVFNRYTDKIFLKIFH